MYLTRPVYSIRIPVLCALLSLAACEGWRALPLRLTHGPLLGDVRATEAVVWARAEGATEVTCRLTALPPARSDVKELSAACDGTRDGTLRYAFSGLVPDREYEVSFPGVPGTTPRRFRTAPPPSAAAPLVLAFGGDVCGQGHGRDVVEGLPAFRAILARTPDLFVGLGDMIYADLDVPRIGKLGNEQVVLGNPLLPGLRSFWTHWRYLHDDAGFAELLAKTPYVAIWDDHEVKNDAGPHHDGGLLATARTALFDWNPVVGAADEPQRLYRALRLGKHCELFVLDCRSYRAANGERDDGATPKSMLGSAQREWLLAALAASDATWKVVVTSVPLCTPTGDAKKGRDAWCDHESPFGFERELLGILRRMQELGIRKPIFLTTDVHHAEVLRLHPFAEAPDFQPLEVITGPLHAGVFGRGVLDTTLAPESLFYLAPDPQPKTLAEAKRLWNFGVLTFAADGTLTIEIVDATGATRFRTITRS